MVCVESSPVGLLCGWLVAAAVAVVVVAVVGIVVAVGGNTRPWRKCL